MNKNYLQQSYKMPVIVYSREFSV